MKNSTHKSGAWKSYVANRQLITKITMRIQLLFLMILITAMHTFGNAAAQSVNLSAKGEPLAKVLDQIESQTGYYLGYRTDMVDSYRVTLELKNATIRQALDACFKNLPIIYKISGRFITLSKKSDGVNQEVNSYEVDRRPVIGRVTTKDGQPFPGATVKVRGTSKITITDKEGRYSLDAENGDVLIFSFVGFQTIELIVTGQPELNAVMIELVNQLSETVVKGYYVTTKELNTGSVSSLKASDIAKQPVSDPIMTLQGRIPGLYVRQNSGVPGSALTVQLRGQNSIGSGNAPLYIVDGVPFNSESLSQNITAASGLSPFNSIRPEDIESIDILKDADATAIYGSRGANGVILITTKKGKAGQTKVDFSVYRGLSTVSHFLKLMNTDQYLNMRREAYRNDGLPVPDKNTSPSSTNYDLTKWDSTNYTDWQEILIGGTGTSTNASGSISGGNVNTKFLLGVSYREETTVYPGEDKNQIASGNLNVNYLSDNKKFRADISVNVSNNSNKLPSADLVGYILTAPNTPKLYGADGELNFENSTFANPMVQTLRTSRSSIDNLLNNVKFSYEIAEGFSIGSSFGYNHQTVSEKNIIPFKSFNPATTSPDLRRRHTRARMEVKSWIVEPQLVFKKDLGAHHVESLFGMTFQSRNKNGLQESAFGFSTDAQIENFAGGINKSDFIDTDIDYRYSALFARIGYNYNERYVLNLTGRRDGSSRFGPKTRFGNFGALGLAWIFSKENFAKGMSFLSDGKLRASLGRTGNDQITDYGYYSNYSAVSAAYLGLATLEPSGLTNPYYGWETIDKFEIALETGFLNSRIRANIGYYKNKTKNQLVGFSLSTVTGYPTIIANLPAEVGNTGFEIDVSSINIQSKKFSWTTSFNVTFPKNKLISFPGIEETIYATQHVVGRPLNQYFAYKYSGVDKTSGLYTFEDLNKDGSITSALDKEPFFLGQKFYGGLNNTLSYNGFSLDFFFQFVSQTGYKEDVNVLAGYFGSNQLASLSDRWQSPLAGGKFQRYSTTLSDPYTATSRYNASDAMVTDASFIRLKNLMLAWTVPDHWRKQLKMAYARLFLQGQNLLTFTTYEGLSLDPEGSSIGTRRLAPLRTVAIGVQLTF